MRLHALTFALLIIGAYSKSIPDKKDIEKKLEAVVKEVLNKDEVPVDNVSSEQELVEPVNGVKDFENNLKKSVRPSDIPVKVLVENVQSALKTEAKKKDNEVSPSSEESSEIVREEIDLKNPGPPQRMQHDTQNPEHFEDAQQAVVLRNSEWRGSSQYAAVQKEINELKETFENKMTELFTSLQEHIKTQSDAEKKEEENIKVRSNVREDSSSTSSGTTNSTSPWGSGPFGGFFSNFAQQIQQGIQNLNSTVNSYWSNSTFSNSPSNSSNGCSGSSPSIFSWGNNNPLNPGQQQGQGQQLQSDEPVRPPGIWQNLQQGVQNIFGNNQQQPAGAHPESQQQTQTNRPVIQAFQNALNIFQPQTQPQKPSQATTEEGANVIPVDAKPDGDKPKDKPEQVTPQPQQSGPIKQMIGNNPVVQGIAGAVQRIQHAIIPTKPREEPVKVSENKEDQATKGGFFPPPPPPHRPISGDNHDVNSSGVDNKIVPGVTPQKETSKEPTKDEDKPEVEEKTE